MTVVVIGITTYKRAAMLEDALRSLEKLETDVTVFVLVADNDPENGDGVRVVHSVKSGYRFPISAILVREKGFTYGRNAILETGFHDMRADFVVTMDDDQLVAPGWLAGLLAMQAESSADIVGPAVWAVFERQPPMWARQCSVYRRDTTTTGRVPQLFGDGGVLVARSALQLLPLPWYDHSFALSGGADADLFRRLRELGARFSRAANAVIYERYSASRVSIRWALQRAFRIGATDVLIIQKYDKSLRTKLTIVLQTIVGVLIAPFLAILNIRRAGRRVDALCKAARALGKASALVGWRYQEYATTHGS